MNKRILIIGYNYHPEPTGIGKYSGEMVKWLAQNGYACEVLTAYPYYPQWEIAEKYKKKKYWYSKEQQSVAKGCMVTVHRCPMYVPAAPTGLTRMLLDLTFFLSAFLRLFCLLFEGRYEYVITVVPSFHLGLLGVFYKTIKRAVIIYHVQDLQIEAAKDLKMITYKPMLNLLFKLERFILNQSDVISTISEGMAGKIQLKVKKDIYLFPNWTDCKFFYPDADVADIKREFGFHQSDKVVLYSGGIGEKQGLEAILYAAKSLETHLHIKFLICGTGPFKQKLQRLAACLNLKNVVFCPLQPLDKFNLFLNMADVHLVIQKSCAGDLVMPSKLTTILGAGGLALITAHEGTNLFSVVNRHRIGILVKPEDQQALNNAIVKATSLNYDDIRRNARTYAVKSLSIDHIMESFEKQVLCRDSKPKEGQVTKEGALLT